MWAEGWEGGKGERGEGAKTKGWGRCYQTGNQSGREFVTMSKKLAIQVSRGSLLFLQGVQKRLLVYCVNIKYLYAV
jgi:hypothetical protein